MDSLEMTLLFISEVKIKRCLTLSRKNYVKKDFTVKESPNKIDAKSSDNIANKNESNSGVQLELTTALRKQFFKHYKLDRHTRSDSDKYTKDFYKFANAVQKGIEKVN